MNRKIIEFVFVVLVLVAGGIAFFRYFPEVFGNIGAAREFIIGFGAFAPILFILLAVLQVILAPLPGQLVGVAGGLVFGVFWGTVYSMIGLVIGTLIVVVLAKRYGRALVEYFVDRKKMKKFDSVVERGGMFTLFLLYLLPALPDDAISYVAGLTKIKTWKIVLLSAIGRFPGMLVLAVVGAGLTSESRLVAVLVFVIAMIISVVIYWYSKKLEGFFVKAAERMRRKFKKV